MRLDLLGANQGLIVGNRLHALLAEGLKGVGVLSQIQLGADEDDGNVWRMVVDLGVPLHQISADLHVMVVVVVVQDAVPWP